MEPVPDCVMMDRWYGVPYSKTKGSPYQEEDGVVKVVTVDYEGTVGHRK